ncbi:MAG: formylglycine-generating enzyme family protein [Nitrospirales bacterium]
MIRLSDWAQFLGVLLAGALLLGADQPPGESVAPMGEAQPMGKDEAPMVLVSAGEFTMGSRDGLTNERPEHKVWVDSFYLDQYEVTIRRYEQFMDATGHDAPPLWYAHAVVEAGDRPAVGTTWFDAEAYCGWAGKRLPTEAEWEKAARGTDGRRYPWGHMQPFPDIANYNRGQWVSYPITLNPVDTVGGMSVRHGTKGGGQSPYGVMQMAGNAAEWVADWYDREYYRKSPEKNPKGPTEGEKKVIRGGSWVDAPAGLLSTLRVSAPPDFGDLTVGFRCAMDAPPGKGAPTPDRAGEPVHPVTRKGAGS